jgi:hypothetical protein
MNVKEDFFGRGKFVVGNGQNTRFWEDAWLGEKPLASQYPELYNIVNRKQVLVSDVLSHVPLNISFRRSLVGNKWSRWLHLVGRIIHIQLSNEQDKFVWSLSRRLNLCI